MYCMEGQEKLSTTKNDAFNIGDISLDMCREYCKSHISKLFQSWCLAFKSIGTKYKNRLPISEGAYLTLLILF